MQSLMEQVGRHILAPRLPTALSGIELSLRQEYHRGGVLNRSQRRGDDWRVAPHGFQNAALPIDAVL
jgi:hypothetical protein